MPINTTSRGIGRLPAISSLALGLSLAFAICPAGFAVAGEKSKNDTTAAVAKAVADEDGGLDLGKLKSPEILGFVKKVGLTRDQQKKIGRLSLEYLLGVVPKLKEFKGLPKEEVVAKAKKLMGGFEKEIKGVLTREQLDKVEQLRAAAADKAAQARAAAAAALEKASKKAAGGSASEKPKDS